MELLQVLQNYTRIVRLLVYLITNHLTNRNELETQHRWQLTHQPMSTQHNLET